MLPSNRCTISREIASPSPVPPWRAASDGFTRLKGWNSRACSSSDNPGPVSVTRKRRTGRASPTGIREMLTTTLPAYASGLDAIAQELADTVNAQHVLGYDAAGNPGQPFFAYNPADPAGSLSVAVTAPGELAASSVPGGGLDAGNATALAGLDAFESSYQRLVNGFGTEVASVRRLAANQQVLTSQVDASREQLAGVSLDEEMVSMLAAQRAYEAASRVMTTVDSVLDTLINRTGLLR